MIASVTGTGSMPLRPTLLGAGITLGVLLVVALAAGLRPRTAEALAAVLIAAALPVLAAPPARAHDPGQGEEIARAQLTVQGDATGTVSIHIGLSGLCPQWISVAVVARRAGLELRAPLEPGSGSTSCAFGGSIRLPTNGTWFVYTELTHAGTCAEAWLPVDTRNPAVSQAERSVYRPAGSTGRRAAEITAAIALYTVSAVLVFWASLAVRRAGRRDPVT